MKEFIFTWSIENISYSWYKTLDYIVSPTFIAGPMQNSAWSLKLYPRGRDDSDFLSLYLSREKDSVSRIIAVNFEFSCISADTSKSHLCFILEAFKTFANSGYVGCGESCFMKRHEVFDRRKDFYLPQDILTLQCRMWKRNKDVDEFGQSFGRTRLTIERLSLVENISPTSAVIQKVFIKSKCQNEN
ncbi:TD and POZ domain-containing protein 1-like [Argiope bruennichi]|uniref:TD and POZ domain-containing protein 1-like n=1 Tax=Argiope bruennichi TaxID=94029 RepID=A0A8T0EP97_ARGBR|nr:TD and POZ domain-containing protein 1-like [Argiope bruennichi]